MVECAADCRVRTPRPGSPFKNASVAFFNLAKRGARFRALCAGAMVASATWAGSVACSALQAAPVSLTLAPGSSLTWTTSLVDLQQAASTAVGLSGDLTADFTLGTQGAFGNVATVADPVAASLLVANANTVVDLEFLGSIDFTGTGLSFNLIGPAMNFIPPPTAVGQTQFSLAGSSLVLNGGTVTYQGQGIIGNAVGTKTFDFNLLPLTFALGASANWTITVTPTAGGDRIAAQIPVSISQSLQADPFPIDLLFSGTLLATLEPDGCVLSSLVGDANNDGSVGAADYALWAAQFGQTGDCLTADFDRNGSVGAADYALWAANFGHSSGGAVRVQNAVAVPEPATALLGVIGLLAVVCGQRRVRRPCSVVS